VILKLSSGANITLKTDRQL